MQNLQQDSRILLANLIKKFGLETYTDVILRSARESIRMCVMEEIAEPAIGESRIGGAPDLVSQEQWPTYRKENDKDAYSLFFLQINLEDLPKIIEPYLASQGMLSVFCTSQNQEGEADVIFHKNTDALCDQALPNIGDFTDVDVVNNRVKAACYYTPRKIEFEKCISLPGDLYMPEEIEEEHEDDYMELLEHLQSPNKGQDLGVLFSHVCQGLPEEDDPKWYSLLTLHSHTDFFTFGDYGKKAFSVLREKIALTDFSDVRCDYCE